MVLGMASNSKSIDMVLTIFTAFSLIIVGIAAAVRDLPNSAHISVPNLVWGYAICDRCKEMAITAKSSSISGLNIVVECLDDKGALEFSASNSTDEKGSFMLHLPESIARSHISVARCSAKVFHIPSECNISTIYTPPSLALQYAQTGQQFYGIGPFVYQPDQPHSSCFNQQKNQNPESNDANPVLGAEAYQSYGNPYAAAAGSYHQNDYTNPLGLNAYGQYGVSVGDIMQGYGYGYGCCGASAGCCGASAGCCGGGPGIFIPRIPSINIPFSPNVYLPRIPGINIPGINIPRLPNVNFPNIPIPGLPNFPNIPIPGLPNFQIPTITIPVPGSPPIQIPGFPSFAPGQAPGSPPIQSPRSPPIQIPGFPSFAPGPAPGSSPIQSPGFPSVTFPGVPPISSGASPSPSPSTQQSPAPSPSPL